LTNVVKKVSNSPYKVLRSIFENIVEFLKLTAR